jgi:hypothetical protein
LPISMMFLPDSPKFTGYVILFCLREHTAEVDFGMQFARDGDSLDLWHHTWRKMLLTNNPNTRYL